MVTFPFKVGADCIVYYKAVAKVKGKGMCWKSINNRRLISYTTRSAFLYVFVIISEGKAKLVKRKERSAYEKIPFTYDL